MMQQPTLDDVRAARRRIAGLAIETPLRPSPSLSKRLGRRVFLKLETMQPTGAFKLRGAANFIRRLSPEQARAGVVAQSSGNHGRAVAYVAAELGIPAVICLSAQVPPSKVEGVRQFCDGTAVEVMIEGADEMETLPFAIDLAERRGMSFIHPFDHPDVIAGQGTLALEVLEACPEIDTLVIPLSGGGLAAGAAMATKAIKPSVRTIGVSQAEGAAMHLSLQAGKIVAVEEAPSLADALTGGISADNRLTVAMCKAWLDETRTVDEDQIAAGMHHALRSERLVLEGGGAVGIALALRSEPGGGEVDRWGKNVAILCTGDNVGLDRLIEIAQAERTVTIG